MHWTQGKGHSNIKNSARTGEQMRIFHELVKRISSIWRHSPRLAGRWVLKSRRGLGGGCAAGGKLIGGPYWARQSKSVGLKGSDMPGGSRESIPVTPPAAETGGSCGSWIVGSNFITRPQVGQRLLQKRQTVAFIHRSRRISEKVAQWLSHESQTNSCNIHLYFSTCLMSYITYIHIQFSFINQNYYLDIHTIRTLFYKKRL